ncbi:hypothetical protein M885DRAFT_544457 [Pelagophyceae sp. CCMP2097]|nr:hypothetical protein M885DRAFT_544457 [Pelagophyceae sp. CCMP2097]
MRTSASSPEPRPWGRRGPPRGRGAAKRGAGAPGGKRRRRQSCARSDAARSRESAHVQGELDRLRRALAVVSGSLDADAATKVREALAPEAPAAAPPALRLLTQELGAPGRTRRQRPPRQIPSFVPDSHYRLDAAAALAAPGGEAASLRRPRDGAQAPPAARAPPRHARDRRRRRASDADSAPGAALGSARSRASHGTPRSSRSALSAQSAPDVLERVAAPGGAVPGGGGAVPVGGPGGTLAAAATGGGYDARAAARMLRAARETKLRGEFWQWDGEARQPAKRPPRSPAGGTAVAPARALSQMRATYLAGAGAESLKRRDVRLPRAPPDGVAAAGGAATAGGTAAAGVATAGAAAVGAAAVGAAAAPGGGRWPAPQPAAEAAGAVHRFDLTAAQVSSVAKYFGDDDEVTLSPPREAGGDGVDDLLDWAANLGDDASTR